MSTAAAVASRAPRIFSGGYSMEPEQSTMITTAAVPWAAVARVAVAPPVEVTVTMAWTSRPPCGRNSFWYTSTLKRGALGLAKFAIGGTPRGWLGQAGQA